MTIYEQTHAGLIFLIVAWSSEDIELICYKPTSQTALSSNKFKTVSEAFYYMHKDLLKQDISCPPCKKRIERQIKRASDKIKETP